MEQSPSSAGASLAISVAKGSPTSPQPRARAERLAPVDNGDKRPVPDALGAGSCMLSSVSETVVEGVGGEILRLRETGGKLTGQGKPEVVHCHGRLKVEG